MRQAVGNENNLGFSFDKSRRRRHPAKVICNTDFTDDTVPLSNTLEQTRLLLSWVETSAKQTGLHINNSITEYMKFNQSEGGPKALNGKAEADTGKPRDCLSAAMWMTGLAGERRPLGGGEEGCRQRST